MQAFLLVVLSLSSTLVLAVEWQRYHYDPDRAIELFLDLDSLHQTAEGFESGIRLSLGQSRQEFLGRQAVNCQSATYKLSNLRELRAGKEFGEEAADESGRVDADTAMSSLADLYCARWQEPPGVRWKAYASAPGETFFFDERMERVRGEIVLRSEIPVYLKTLGEKKSLYAKVRISCLENRFAILSGVYRDETRGWLANITPGNLRTPVPDSSVAILRSMLCGSGDMQQIPIRVE